MTLYNQYQHYIASHELKTFTAKDGFKIEYHYQGQGKKTICAFFGGSMFPSETYFLLLQELEKEYKVLVIQYPKKPSSITDYIRKIHQLITHLGIKEMVVIGGNHGGIIAQVFTKLYIECVDQLILYNTMTRSKDLTTPSEQMAQNHLEAISKLKELRTYVDLEQVKSLLYNKIEENLQEVYGLQNTYSDFFEYLISNYDANDESVQMYMIESFLTSYRFAKEDFIKLAQRVLVIHGYDEEFFSGAEHIETLVDLFTEPQLEFVETDQYKLAIDHQKFLQRLKSFLKI